MAIHISVEGLDGTGKSTLVKELSLEMNKDKDFYPWIYATKEPGLETFVQGDLRFVRPGVDLRDIVLKNEALTPLERELLFYVDASQHRRFIKDQGRAIIISDRGLWSHLAYLRGLLKIKQINHDEYSVGRKLIELLCPVPDKVVYLRGDIALMEERTAGKTKDVIEKLGPDYYSYVQETYEDLSLSASKCLILDAKLSTSENCRSVIDWLKKEFNHEQLQSGDT